MTTHFNQVLAGVTLGRAKVRSQDLINFPIIAPNFAQIKPPRLPLCDPGISTKNATHDCSRLAPRNAEHRDRSLTYRRGDCCNRVFESHQDNKSQIMPEREA